MWWLCYSCASVPERQIECHTNVSLIFWCNQLPGIELDAGIVPLAEKLIGQFWMIMMKSVFIHVRSGTKIVIDQKICGFPNPHGFLAVCLHDLQVAPADVECDKVTKMTTLRIVRIVAASVVLMLWCSVNVSGDATELLKVWWCSRDQLKMEAPAPLPGYPMMRGKRECETQLTVLPTVQYWIYLILWLR